MRASPIMHPPRWRCPCRLLCAEPPRGPRLRPQEFGEFAVGGAGEPRGRGGRAACVPAPVPTFQVPAGGAGCAVQGGGVGCGGRGARECSITRVELWPRLGKWNMRGRMKRSESQSREPTGAGPRPAGSMLAWAFKQSPGGVSFYFPHLEVGADGMITGAPSPLMDNNHV